MPYSQTDFLSRMIAVNFAAEGSLRFSGGRKVETLTSNYPLSPRWPKKEERRRTMVIFNIYRLLCLQLHGQFGQKLYE